jgi:hypothetical protein
VQATPTRPVSAQRPTTENVISQQQLTAEDTETGRRLALARLSGSAAPATIEPAAAGRLPRGRASAEYGTVFMRGNTSIATIWISGPCAHGQLDRSIGRAAAS